MLIVVIATLGLEIVLTNLAGIMFGYDVQLMPSPFSREPILIAGIRISEVNIAILVISAILMVALFIFYKYTKIGTAMRATQQNIVGAHLMGINTSFTFVLTWMISAVVGAVGGMLITTITLLDTNSLGGVMIKSFSGAVLGGFGNPIGAVVGGLLIGVLENVAVQFLPAEYASSIAFLIIVFVLLVRPSGLFETKETQRV